MLSNLRRRRWSPAAGFDSSNDSPVLGPARSSRHFAELSDTLFRCPIFLLLPLPLLVLTLLGIVDYYYLSVMQPFAERAAIAQSGQTLFTPFAASWRRAVQRHSNAIGDGRSDTVFERFQDHYSYFTEITAVRSSDRSLVTMEPSIVALCHQLRASACENDGRNWSGYASATLLGPTSSLRPGQHYGHCQCVTMANALNSITSWCRR